MKPQEIREIASVAEFREMLMPWIEEDRKRREAQPKEPQYMRLGIEPELMAKAVATDFLSTVPKRYVKVLKHDNPLLVKSPLEVAQPIPAKVVWSTLKKMKTIQLS